MKIAIILGTRPEIIKMSPIIRYCEEKRIDYHIIHTNQHYSSEMDEIFFRELNLPKPTYNLNIGSGGHAEMTGRMLIRLEKVLTKTKPSVVLVEGDTNTVLAGALAAVKLHIKVGHIEAGLRSYDNQMPEEHNRVIVDHISDYLFCPTKISKSNVVKENIPASRLFVTGNTIVEAVKQNLDIAKEKSNIMKKLKLKKQGYFLVTAHREENVDNPKKLNDITTALAELNRKYKTRIIYPIHPRTMKNLKEYKIKVPKSIELLKPVGYLDMLMLEKNARVILTDSGGLQEEACILKIPCVTLRDNTERPETIEAGANMLAGCNIKKIMSSVSAMLKRKKDWPNPFGDGNATKKIMKILLKK